MTGLSQEGLHFGWWPRQIQVLRGASGDVDLRRIDSGITRLQLREVVFNRDSVEKDRCPRYKVYKNSDEWKGRSGECAMTRGSIVVGDYFSSRRTDYLFETKANAMQLTQCGLLIIILLLITNQTPRITTYIFPLCLAPVLAPGRKTPLVPSNTQESSPTVFTLQRRVGYSVP